MKTDLNPNVHHASDAQLVTIKIWSIDGKVISAFGDNATVSCVEFSSDSKRLVASWEPTSAKIFEVESGKELKEFCWATADGI